MQNVLSEVNLLAGVLTQNLEDYVELYCIVVQNLCKCRIVCEGLRANTKFAGLN